MKIYKNNFLTLLLFLLLIVSVAYEALKLLKDYHTLDTEHLFIFYSLVVVFAVSVLIAVLKFKIFVTTNLSIIIIYPFQFRYRSVNKNSVNRLSWDNLRFAILNFRQMSIYSRSGTKINISDLEFYNFSDIENEMMKIVSTDRKGRRAKEDVAYDQAHFNKPVVELALLLLAIVLVFLVLAMIKYQSMKIIVLLIADAVFLIQMKLLRDFYVRVMNTYNDERFSEKRD